MLLNEILKLNEETIKNTKIHFAIGAKIKHEPLYEFYKGTFKERQEHQNNKNFERKFILSLIYYKSNERLFGGFYEKISISKTNAYFLYHTKLLNIGTEFIGKLILEFKKDFRASYVLGEKYFNNLNIIELLRNKYTTEAFPGYENININFDLLKTIITQEEPSWKTALTSVKGIYLISDKTNGKLYIGSAYGNEAFWNRWKSYSENGHGNNKELKEIIKTNGADYAKNFQFSILEVRNMITDDDEIINRESYWKEILLSRNFGYNSN